MTCLFLSLVVLCRKINEDGRDDDDDGDEDADGYDGGGGHGDVLLKFIHLLRFPYIC